MIHRLSPLFLTLFATPGLVSAQTIVSSEPAQGSQKSLNATAESAISNEANSPEQPTRIEARERFTAGIKLYEEGDFALALIEFERAYSLVPDHRVLYNIGQVNIQLGRYARAVRSLRQYLNEGMDRITEERKQAVLNDLNMLSVRTATLLVKVNVSDAEVLLDNDVVAITPMPAPVLVDAGEHRLSVRKAGYVSEVKPLALAGRDEITEDVTLRPEPKHVSTEKTVIVERKPALSSNGSDPRNLYLILGWSAVGLLGASWATTGYLGYQAEQDRKSALERKTSLAELDRLSSKTHNWYMTSDVLGATTLLATGGMIYYTLMRPASRAKSERKATAKATYFLDVGPRNISIAGTF
jgi:tetratricopeptide (TPR) repeat protein